MDGKIRWVTGHGERCEAVTDITKELAAVAKKYGKVIEEITLSDYEKKLFVVVITELKPIIDKSKLYQEDIDHFEEAITDIQLFYANNKIDLENFLKEKGLEDNDIHEITEITTVERTK